MHQTVSTPAPAPLTVKQRRARRKKQIIYGLIALVVLWIVGSIIWGKREKPIPGHNGDGDSQDHRANCFGNRENTT